MEKNRKELVDLTPYSLKHFWRLSNYNWRKSIIALVWLKISVLLPNEMDCFITVE